MGQSSVARVRAAANVAEPARRRRRTTTGSKRIVIESVSLTRPINTRRGEMANEGKKRKVTRGWTPATKRLNEVDVRRRRGQRENVKSGGEWARTTQLQHKLKKNSRHTFYPRNAPISSSHVKPRQIRSKQKLATKPSLLTLNDRFFFFTTSAQSLATPASRRRLCSRAICHAPA